MGIFFFFNFLNGFLRAVTELFSVFLVCTHINQIIYLQEICMPEDEGFHVSVKQHAMCDTITLIFRIYVLVRESMIRKF